MPRPTRNNRNSKQESSPRTSWKKPDGTPLRKRRGDYFPDEEIYKRSAPKKRFNSDDRKPASGSRGRDDKKPFARREDSNGEGGASRDRKPAFGSRGRDDKKPFTRREDSAGESKSAWERKPASGARDRDAKNLMHAVMIQDPAANQLGSATTASQRVRESNLPGMTPTKNHLEADMIKKRDEVVMKDQLVGLPIGHPIALMIAQLTVPTPEKTILKEMTQTTSINLGENHRASEINAQAISLHGKKENDMTVLNTLPTWATVLRKAVDSKNATMIAKGHRRLLKNNSNQTQQVPSD